ncbi:CPBP family glutamic-type intramembrane protease [Fuchsiella alkaliacetigena]|uniref:CPBP family glutamic-type intramembrane protease n=1 Tax=Fuchsiella alkaliacetigena TaxID=957042 RepID=UPI00200A9923|nr:CPBP family intramembrane glutamic endopeptidase [Fuchsiella alkaliacetigena]MCK8824386.1 CPBP family glutamic-type intramembrane protease [Fuchsiella alkaliacetigena]
MIKELITNQKKEHNWNKKELLKLQLIWYLSLLLLSITEYYHLPNMPELESFFHFLAGISIKLLLIAYLIYTLLFKQNFSLKQIGLSSQNLFTGCKLGIKVSLPLLVMILLLIHLPQEHLNLNQKFQPLITVSSLEDLINSFFYFLTLLLLTIVPALATELFYRVVIYQFFKERLGVLLGGIVAAIYYAITLLNFDPNLLLAHFLVGGISIYLYERSSSLIAAIIWQAIYQATIILYIFGF